jgi:hypothetical protein
MGIPKSSPSPKKINDATGTVRLRPAKKQIQKMKNENMVINTTKELPQETLRSSSF